MSTSRRLVVSGNAHLIMPYHQELDRLTERFLGSNALGTTKRGIGPAYADKSSRVGLRVQDLLDPKIFREKLDVVLHEKNLILTKIYNRPAISALSDIAERYLDELAPARGADDRRHGRPRARRVGARPSASCSRAPRRRSSTSTTAPTLRHLLQPGRRRRLRGLGSRAARHHLHRRHRQGLRHARRARARSRPNSRATRRSTSSTRGHEFGTNTGRRRRVGWFDAVMARQAVRLNSLTEIALTKLDVLDKFDEIKVCVAYEHEGVRYDHMPFHQSVLHEVTPVYETLRGLGERAHRGESRRRDARGRDGLRQLPRRADRRADLGRRGRPRARTVRAHLMTRCVVVGSGAREHALAYALSRSARSSSRRATPASPPTGSRCVATPAIDLEADLFVIGPEQPLVDGLADQLRARARPSSDQGWPGPGSRAPRPS